MTPEYRESITDHEDDDLIADLELRCRADVSDARSIGSCRVRVDVAIRPANVAERNTFVVNAHASEFRRQSMTCIAAVPIMVGSVFHTTFERNQLAVAPALAVCDRCTMLGETSFELRFNFVQPIDLPAAAGAAPTR